MAKTIDKTKLTQDKQLQKQKEREKAQGNQLLGARSKIKGEMNKDLARVQSIKKSQSDADKAFKIKQQQSKQKANEQTSKELKEYFNSKNRSKMQMPRMGVNPKELTVKGGPRKFLKRI
tara:strand:- start:79 stop:435 length:357 start_codon:yes stop_codon:yes gene_type:complete